MEKQHTGLNIRRQFRRVINEWDGLKDKLHLIACDGASSNNKVGEIVNQIEHCHFSHVLLPAFDEHYNSIWCAAHVLHLCVKTAISTQPVVMNSIRHVGKIVEHFARSVKARHALKKVQLDQGVLVHLIPIKVCL